MPLPLPAGAAKIAKLNVTLVLCCLFPYEARANQAQAHPAPAGRPMDLSPGMVLIR
jgi:hypothetical protein